jgi:hypothetical protein
MGPGEEEGLEVEIRGPGQAEENTAVDPAGHGDKAGLKVAEPVQEFLCPGSEMPRWNAVRECHGVNRNKTGTCFAIC